MLELCDGGDLYTRSPYSEYQAAHILAQVLSAINYMHSHGVVHRCVAIVMAVKSDARFTTTDDSLGPRDVKFENIMFENQKIDAEVKIIDFGLSKKFLGRPSYMTERVGTIYLFVT